MEHFSSLKNSRAFIRTQSQKCLCHLFWTYYLPCLWEKQEILFVRILTQHKYLIDSQSLRFCLRSMKYSPRSKGPSVNKSNLKLADERIAEARVQLTLFTLLEVTFRPDLPEVPFHTDLSYRWLTGTCKDQQHELCHPECRSAGWGSFAADPLAWRCGVILPCCVAQGQLSVPRVLPGFCQSTETSRGNSWCEHWYQRLIVWQKEGNYH